MNRSAILQPNSEFERKEELNRLLNKTISEEEQQVLNECTTQDHESIALIGCIVKEDSLVNLARLIIASKNQSNIELAHMAELRLLGYEQQKLIEQMSEQFLTNTQNISKVEDRIYYTLFDVLS